MSLFTQSMSVTGSAINTASPWVIVGDDSGAVLNVTRSTHNLEYKVQYSLADPNRTTATAYTYATVTSGDAKLVHSIRIPPPVAAVRVIADGVSAAEGGGTGTLSIQGKPLEGTYDNFYSAYRNVLTFPGVAEAVAAGTDATAVIQVAIDACAPLSIPLFFPAGTYRVKNLLIKAGTVLLGCGRATILKLTDDAVGNWDFVIGTYLGGTYADIDNVIIRGLLVDGNKAVLLENPTIAAKIGDGTCQMHGITLYGEHDNWLLDNVHSQNTGGDGIMVTAAASGTKIPTNVRILSCTQSGCGRQDIAVVNVDGCIITGCSGDGTCDIEANAGAETCRNIVATGLRYSRVYVSTHGATDGLSEADNIYVSGVIASEAVSVWGVGRGLISGVIAPKVTISECYGTRVSNARVTALEVTSTNGTMCRDLELSGINVLGTADYAYGIKLTNTSGIKLLDSSITAGGADGIYISNFEDAAADIEIVSTEISGHARYGIYFVSAASSASRGLFLSNVKIKTSGTSPVYYGSGVSEAYGSLHMKNCIIVGALNAFKPARLFIDGLTVMGNYNMFIQNTAGWSASIDNVLFIRDSAGTPSISFNGATEVAGLRLGKIEQVQSGGFTLTGTITFASGVKAWIDGPVVTATTWADAIGANVTAGSMYRLRGNTTNWGYTHNGTEWVAKAH